MEITKKLSNLKLVTQTQVDLAYIAALSGQAEDAKDDCVKLQKDIQFINQIGGQLFSCYSNTDGQDLWMESLTNGVDKTIKDAQTLLEKLDGDETADFRSVLGTLVKDCADIKDAVVNG